MNVQEVNSTGKHIWAFIITAVTIFVLALVTWTFFSLYIRYYHLYKQLQEEWVKCRLGLSRHGQASQLPFTDFPRLVCLKFSIISLLRAQQMRGDGLRRLADKLVEKEVAKYRVP